MTLLGAVVSVAAGRCVQGFQTGIDSGSDSVGHQQQRKSLRPADGMEHTSTDRYQSPLASLHITAANDQTSPQQDV